jgi:phosphoglycerate dehydrogenase-like enzyme
MTISTKTPLRILMSEAARGQLAADVAKALDRRPHLFAGLGEDADVAFVSRDVTGLSTKHTVLADTQRFYDAMLGAPSLRWVHAHSAGADRPIYTELQKRGVTITTSSGANASIVVQTALAGILALARRFPQLMQAQREKSWSPLIGAKAPRDLAGQTAVIVGWGPIGQGIAALLSTIGMRVTAVRSDALNAAPAAETVAFENIEALLPQADWLVLACPLTDRTRGLIDAKALSLLPAGAHLVNVSRGEVIHEEALIEALDEGRLAGAYLDVFEHEPLSAASPLWGMRNVILTPHSAGHSDGNEKRVGAIFLDNLARHAEGRELLYRTGSR